MIEFGRFAEENRQSRGEGKPETFDFLGFTHICAKRRSDGKFTLWRRAIVKRMRRKLKEIEEVLMQHRHEPVAETERRLKTVVQGFLNYCAVPDNSRQMSRFRGIVNRLWFRALRRRSQKGRKWTWERMQRLIEKLIPPARMQRPYPNQRLHVSYPR
ncbi:hypothetical protein JW926_03955 [Candidatus Sumerlaeota bacterium]|nr:hypothetical protein [Candidatus Sumerlaeota bacterium]